MKNKYQQQTDEAMKRFIYDNSDYSFEKDKSIDLEDFSMNENQPIKRVKKKGNLNKKPKKRINIKHRRK